MKINTEGLELIKRFEGFSAKPYRCPAGVWTIGYGHTRGVGTFTATITEQEAHELLLRDVRESERAVAELVDAPLNENQFSALVSFVFNIGAGAFARSSLLRKLNAREVCTDEFMRWKYANGKPLQGLKTRRHAERELFLKEPQ